MTVTTEKQKTVAPGKLNWSLDQEKKKKPLMGIVMKPDKIVGFKQ